jgi:hypothetical protein
MVAQMDAETAELVRNDDLNSRGNQEATSFETNAIYPIACKSQCCAFS